MLLFRPRYTLSSVGHDCEARLISDMLHLTHYSYLLHIAALQCNTVLHYSTAVSVVQVLCLQSVADGLSLQPLRRAMADKP